MTSSILQKHKRYTDGSFSPVDEVRSALVRSMDKRADHVFTKRTPERAIAAAKMSACRFASGNARGALDGITVVWKDLFDQTGEITTAGSKTRLSAQAARSNAGCVTLLE